MVAYKKVNQIKYTGFIKLNQDYQKYRPREFQSYESSAGLSISNFYLSNKQLVKYKSREYIFVLDGQIYDFDDQPFLEDQLMQFVDRLSRDPDNTLRLTNGEFVLFLVYKTLPKVIIATSVSGNAALFYRKFSGSIDFSNSFNEIIKSGDGPPALRQQRIYDILTGNSLGSAKTCFSEIARLEHGRVMKIDKGQISVSEYNDLIQYPSGSPVLEDPYEEFRRIFSNALKNRLKGAHIGIALSSGKDSTSVAVIAESILKENQKVFGYTFYPDFLPADQTSNFRYNENILLQSLLDRYPKIQGKKVEVPLGTILSSLEKSLEIYGEPVYGISNQYWIQKMHEMMRQDNCDIMLTGQGGNYTISWPPPELVSARQKKRHLFLINMLKSLKHKPELPYLTKQFMQGVNKDHFMGSSRPHEIHRLQPILIKNSLSYSGYLQKQASLYHGFQISDPTMDRKLIEFCLRMPFDVYHDDNISRKLVAVGLMEMIPDDIRENTIRSIQASDIQYRLQQERGDFVEKLEFLNTNKIVTFVVETEKLLRDWKRIDFSKVRRTELNHLLRLIQVGMFLSKFRFTL